MQLEDEIRAVVQSHGADLYDVELRKEGTRIVYQIFIQKEGGVNVDLCADISRTLSPLFDVKPPVAGEYTLEVSSPGIERRLNTPKHFMGAVGEEIKFTTKDKKRHKGVLSSADESGFVVNEQSFSYDAVAKANVIFDWKK